MPKTLTKKPANLSLDAELLKEARALEINISSAAEEGLKQAVSKAKAEAWKRENAEAIRSSNEWVEKNGLPLEKYRMF
ncbi:MAG: type II toxin-antitoxin system CcdA family antitoxin [Nitratireductor sp.]|nr:type II toxin-antitoxin system CcdA family antitoxin [Nitratireductor sp.]